MKSLITLTLIAMPILAQATIQTPPETENGFENVNKRKEYRYYGYEGEQIWYEFGRPYWRKSGTTAKVEKVIEQKMTETKSAPQREIRLENMGTQPITLDVKFELNKSDIIKTYTTAIDQLGKSLKENKDINIEVQGHTDTTGSDLFNNALSNNRAHSVRSYLIENFGISKKRIKATGYGSKKPVASNEHRPGRQKNRRVNVQIIK